MLKIFTDFINGLARDLNLGVTWDITAFIKATFNIEDTLGGIGQTLFDNLQHVFYSFALWLLILKFCKKGFETYILGIEGDIDSEPTTLIIRYIKAVVMIVLFPILYQYLADITVALADTVTTIINNSTTVDYSNLFGDGKNWWDGFSALGNGLIATIIMFVGIVMLLFQIYMRGAEMFVLRLGFPIACIGLLESDNGVFAPYLLMFFKSALTSLIQISLFQISIYMYSEKGFNFVIATCFLALAISTPKFLQQFLVPTGGGGVSNKIYMASRVAGMIIRK